MNVEAPKPAPKGALRRLGQKLEQILPPLDESSESRRGKPPDQDGSGFNSPLDIITIFINNMMNFSYAKADEARADEARIKIEKKSQTTPESPPQLSGEPGPSLGKLIKTFNEIKENLYHR
jgi:hypothetical protein